MKDISRKSQTGKFEVFVSKLNVFFPQYSDPADNTTIIFERQVLDANKKIIVLKASEDKRGVTNSTNKRTYIVLVQAPPVPEHKNSFYYMVFAYIR